jgi:hypothetical protein
MKAILPFIEDARCLVLITIFIEIVVETAAFQIPN